MHVVINYWSKLVILRLILQPNSLYSKCVIGFNCIQSLQLFSGVHGEIWIINTKYP